MPFSVDVRNSYCTARPRKKPILAPPIVYRPVFACGATDFYKHGNIEPIAGRDWVTKANFV